MNQRTFLGKPYPKETEFTRPVADYALLGLLLIGLGVGGVSLGSLAIIRQLPQASGVQAHIVQMPQATALADQPAVTPQP